MRKCILCGKNPAVLPDRESGSSAKKVCRNCHGKRLQGDLQHILEMRERFLRKHLAPAVRPTSEEGA